MANLCKFEKKQYKVSYNNGVTWNTVVPEQNKPGDMIEYDSSDCSTMEGMYRWRVLDGQYLCEDKEKYQKEIQEESYDNGATWYVSYPTVYRTGQYVGRDETYCNDKFVGHYIGGDISVTCPSQYVWNGYKCVRVDPLKVVKCDGNSTLTRSEINYYTSSYILISANIGNCVTSIGNNAFSYCTSLTSIDIPNSVTSIDNEIFAYCSGLTSCTIGSGVTTIGNSAFQSCSGLTSIDIPNSVTSIGTGCFAYCSGLTSCTIGSGVTNIGDGAFLECNSLSSIEIPSSVTTIGDDAFYLCTSLTSITVHATTPPVVGSAFYNTNGCPIYVPCESLFDYKSAWSGYASRIQGIPPCEPTPTGVTKIQTSYSNGDFYFKYCDSSTELTSGDTQPSGYTASAMTSAVIGDCVTSIGNNAFYYCSSLTSIDIPDSVTSIGGSAFRGCRSLTSIDIPSGVTSIGSYTFYRCRSLTSIDIPSGVTSIGGSAIRNCSSLTSIDIPSGVTSIGSNAFRECSSLTSITINATTPPTLYNANAFDDTNNCPIYVPSASVETYKTSWRTYSSRIQAIP